MQSAHPDIPQQLSDKFAAWTDEFAQRTNGAASPAGALPDGIAESLERYAGGQGTFTMYNCPLTASTECNCGPF